MNTYIFLGLFFALGLIYFSIGIKNRNSIKSSSDYFVAGRSLGLLQLSANLIATQLGGGLILGTAASAYSSGFYSLLYPLGISLGFVLLGSGIAGRLQECEVITTAELFEKRYQSRNLRKLASTLSLLTLFGILMAQVVCIKTILAGLGYSNWVAITFWLLMAGYTMIGGIRAITLNDIVQLILIVIVFTALFVYLSFNSTANWALMSQQIQAGLFSDATSSRQQTLSLLFIPALFSLIEQDLAQRFFAAKSKTVATQSAWVAAVFLLLFSFIPIYLGMLARVLKLPASEQINPLFSLLGPLLSPLAYSFVLCAIFAAIISTADALINGICANLTEDFSLKERMGSEKQALRISKLISLGVSLLALLGSYLISPHVLEILIGSYELSVSALLVPLLYAVYKKNLSRSAAWLSTFFGLFAFLLISTSFESSIRVFVSLGLSFLGYQLGSSYDRFSKKEMSYV